MVFVTFGFGVASLNLSDKFEDLQSTDVCPVSQLTKLMIVNAVFDMIAGAVLCTLMAYGVASTAGDFLDRMMRKVVIVFRCLYSLLPSLIVMSTISYLLLSNYCVS